MANRWGKSGNSERLFFGVPKSLQMVTAAMKLKDSCSLEESYDKAKQHIKKQRQYFASKGHLVKAMVFPVAWMWELDYKESWAPKNWCFWTVVLEKTLESPLDSKIKAVNPRGNQPWIFIGRTDAEAEAPIIWPPDEQLTHWKRPGCLERLKAEGEGGGRGWDGWMVLWIHWIWTWANSERRWGTEKPGVLQSTGYQRVGQDLATDQQ